tara:strand:- start:302 stop:856 length:555 start_codon:yes stop_codon:yes gene_type:complete
MTYNLFPVPVEYIPNAITELECFYLKKRIKEIKHLNHESIKGNGFSTHNPHETYPLLSKDIHVKLQAMVDEYNMKVGNIPSLITYTWSNIQHKNSILREHCHPQSLVSGALYINVDNDQKIYFHNPNPYPYYTPKDKITPYNMEHQFIKVTNGSLVLFPSWLRHGKDDELNTMDERIVISFNAT